MLIGELAKSSGLSRDTIRFYEKQGLIEVGRKERRFNNYKEYSESTLQRLLQIRRIKGLGFTLNEVAGLLAMVESNTASCANISEKVAEKALLIDQRIIELQELKASMINRVRDCLQESAPDVNRTNCPILISD
nr:MerR family transcriptional regulator [uncultured Dyadobacter sp.]